MSVQRRGKEATSHYGVKAAYRDHTLLAVRLESGRTHQIRVHMAHIGHPVVGDPVYGGRGATTAAKGQRPRLTELLRGFRRQALHAERLGLNHPESAEPLEWTAPMPDDMQRARGGTGGGRPVVTLARRFINVPRWGWVTCLRSPHSAMNTGELPGQCVKHVNLC